MLAWAQALAGTPMSPPLPGTLTGAKLSMSLSNPISAKCLKVIKLTRLKVQSYCCDPYERDLEDLQHQER